VAFTRRDEMTDSNDRKPQREYSRRQGRESSWAPLVPIILVATIVFAIIDNRSDASERGARAGESTFSDTAFLSGIERRYASTTFQQGDAEAFMGGIDLDFRDAIIEGDEARLNVSAVMGGIQIRVPRSWNVVNRVTTALGGVQDRTRSSDANKRLIIEGTVVLGGLEISN
jgi:predicted membrane protein